MVVRECFRRERKCWLLTLNVCRCDRLSEAHWQAKNSDGFYAALVYQLGMDDFDLGGQDFDAMSARSESSEAC